MAIDHGPQGIRVNRVCPGDAETPMEHADAESSFITSVAITVDG
jgi:NAD(P)-dependent dehydrogenase (short-subunit alcohol dehydrogenase family)